MGAVLDAPGGGRDPDLVGLRIARVADLLVHRRREEPTALGPEIELVVDGLGERQVVKIGACRGVEGDDRPPQRRGTDMSDAGQHGNRICPRTRGIDQDRRRELLGEEKYTASRQSLVHGHEGEDIARLVVAFLENQTATASATA